MERNSNKSLGDPLHLHSFTAAVQELVGRDDFEQRYLVLVRESGILPMGVAHAMRFNPKTNTSRIVDENGVVEGSGGPIERIIDTFSTELPAFKLAMESAFVPAALSRYQSREEIERSTIWNAVIRPFGWNGGCPQPSLDASGDAA